MGHGDFLIYVLVFLAAAVIVIPVFKRFGLSAVLGYLAAGILIGPSGFGLIHETEGIMNLAELGVVFLLFIIGLELKPSRLWTMRKSMLGSGGMQMLTCTLAIFGLLQVASFAMKESLIVAYALSLSSTALVLQLLSEQNQLNAYHGRQAFSVLLFQDLAVIPMMAILPFMATGASNVQGPGILALVILFAVVAGFHFLSRPVLGWVAKAESRELFTSLALLVVISVAAAMHAVHLSMELGAFVAGMMLSGSEYRHQLEADIEPFKGLLLGLFFMGVGMGLDSALIVKHWPMLLFSAFALMLIKSIVIFLVGRVGGLNQLSALKFGVILSQGGEFAFVLLGIATAIGLVSTNTAAMTVPVVTISMMCTPFLFSLVLKVSSHQSNKESKPDYDQMEENLHPKVIVAGLGRFGQITARILRTMDIPFTALEHDPNQVEVLRRFGNLVYYGDGTRVDMLTSAGAAHAKIFLVAIVEKSTSAKIVMMVRKHFPHLVIVARARNRQHAIELMQAGAHHVIRETFASALEAATEVLVKTGVEAESAKKVINAFRENDEELLSRQVDSTDETQQLVAQSLRQLTEVLKDDIGKK